MAHSLERFIEELTREVWQLEQRVTGGHMGNPEEFLEELFQARHGLLAVRTMGALGAEVYGRVAALGDHIQAADLPLVTDVGQTPRLVVTAQHRHAVPTTVLTCWSRFDRWIACR
jgi:magnesium transporter